jgi:hypothetical protein
MIVGPGAMQARSYELRERQPVSRAVWQTLQQSGCHGHYGRRLLRAQVIRLGGPQFAHLRPGQCPGVWTVTRNILDLTEVEYLVTESCLDGQLVQARREAYLEGRCKVRGEWLVARTRVELTIMDRIIGGRIWQAFTEAEVALACLG